MNMNGKIAKTVLSLRRWIRDGDCPNEQPGIHPDESSCNLITIALRKAATAIILQIMA